MIWKRIQDRVLHSVLGPIQSRGYWHVRTPVSRQFAPGHVGSYYLDFSPKADYSGPQVNGVPVMDYGPLRNRYNPVTVCQMALGCYERWATRERGSIYQERFFLLADWLVNHQQRDGDQRGAWVYEIPNVLYGPLSIPWVSAMAQGQAISVLVRAHMLSEQTRYLEAASAALEPFYKTTVQGGVAVVDQGSEVFFEEAPSLKPSRILNGAIFAIWGLYDYHTYTGDRQVLTLYERAVNTLIHLLPAYDLGYWSRYDLYPFPYPNVASPYYHGLHIAQLSAFHRLTDQPQFLETTRRWQEYQNHAIHAARAVAHKAIFKLIWQARRGP